MRERPRKFSPLTSVSTDRLSVNLDLPFDLSKKIGIHTRFAQSLMQLGGVRRTTVVGMRGDTSKTVPQVIGMDSGGSALAGGVKVEVAETYDYSLTDSDELGRRKWSQSRWRDLHLKVNTTEIQQKIRLSERNVQHAASWASELDRCLKRALVQAGIHNLLHTMRTEDKALAVFVYSYRLSRAIGVGVNDLLAGTARLHPPTAEGLLLEFFGAAIYWNTFNSVLSGFEHSGYGHRLSFFVGPELDRALMLNVVAKVNTLVSPTNPTK